MRKATLAAGALALVTVFSASRPAAANINPHTPKVLLHVLGTTSKGQCTTWFTNSLPNCDNAITQGQSAGDGSKSYYVYVAVAKGDSMPDLAGIQLGVNYDNGIPGNISDAAGIDMFAWTLCATLQFAAGPPAPQWTNGGAEPLSGILITWDATAVCQTGLVSNAGYFYITAYGPSKLSVIPRPIDGLVKAADCRAAETGAIPASALGYAQFSASGSTLGCNPCLTPCAIIPTKPATWSTIKSMYKGN